MLEVGKKRRTKYQSGAPGRRQRKTSETKHQTSACGPNAVGMRTTHGVFLTAGAQLLLAGLARQGTYQKAETPDPRPPWCCRNDGYGLGQICFTYRI